MIFLTIILNNPNRLHRLTYQTIVNSIFNLVYIQSILKLILISSDFSSFKNNSEIDFSNIEDYMSFIFRHLGFEFLSKDQIKLKELLVRLVIKMKKIEKNN
jgi:hypothetical protein